MLEMVVEVVVMVDMGTLIPALAAVLVDILEMVEMLIRLVPHILNLVLVDQVEAVAVVVQEDL
jgi:hypothetical protein